ncbi:MAG: AraC family transcriptional regulator [Bacteroidota bacterium]
MIKSNNHYNTLASFLQSIGYETVDAQFVIHRLQEVSPPPPYQSPIFRANYFTFVLMKTAQSRYTLDNNSYEVRDQTLYFTNPGHLKSFALLDTIDGLLISFSEEYLKQYIESDVFALFPYLLSEIVPPQYLSDELFDELWQLGQQIRKENEKGGPHSTMLVASYFKIFLLKINEKLYPDYNPREDGDRNSAIVRRFKINLENHIRSLIEGRAEQLHQVADFADLQGLHPSYFSTVIKAKTDRNVSEWISDKIIQEAKSQLIKSSASIKEIAYRLGFSEANYFSKYFKKYTGSTPGAFRKSQS